MNEKNGIGESKPKQSQRQGKSTPELPVGRAYAVDPLTVSKVLKLVMPIVNLHHTVHHKSTNQDGWQTWKVLRKH